VAEISTLPVLLEVEDIQAFALTLRTLLDAIDDALAFREEYESEADNA
jgi:hypothetical protein